MPHSTRGSADNSTPTPEATSPMPSTSSTPPGLALASSGQIPPSATLKQERRSLPETGIYANLIGNKTNFDEFLQKHLGDKDSMIAAYNNSSQQRKQYYEEQFQYKDNGHGGIRERVQRESPVIAELRTNVIIKDEFTLVTDLSYHLAARYTRPDSAIMVKVDHSSCLAMGGTFDPCYILAISTVPTQMGPTMNKRNAALIQSFMADILSVPPERGIVKFLPVPEDNFATNGTTIAGEIERQEKQQSGANDSTIRRAMNNPGRKSVPSFKKSMSRLDNEAKSSETKAIVSADLKNTSTKSSDGAAAISRNTTPPAALSPVGVFELPAGESEKKRPATAHAHSSSTGSNGLRMNGVSSKSLSPRNSGTPKGRPQTVSGSSIQQQIKQSATALASAPPPPPVRLTSGAVPSSKRDRPPSFLKVDPTKLIRPLTPRQKAPPPEEKPQPRDSVTSPTPVAVEDGEKKALEDGDEKNKQNKKDPAANTAKRRSTITATPKIPELPPTPSMNEDKKSTKSMRIGKRKSFLSAFRRSTAATPAAG